MEIALIKSSNNSIRFSAKVNSKYFPNLKKCADNNIKYSIYSDKIFEFIEYLEEDLAYCYEKFVINNQDNLALQSYNDLSSFHNNFANTGDSQPNDLIVIRHCNK